jgi:hypothetical protein
MTSITGGQVTDASTTPQVWTRGRVEKVVVMVNNLGLRLVKIRVVQDRIPELGDKFCLTDDHEVLTDNGWKSISMITKEDKVAQLNKLDHCIEYVFPKETFVFNHTDEMYLIQTERGSQYVTSNHRLFVKEQAEHKYELVMAHIVSKLYLEKKYVMLDSEMNEVLITNITRTEKNEIGDRVYCISVPSEIFLVRRKNETVALWTGNSNRHGQKGTIGALLRGHDMPRTESGIVPDMIMNPHAIPSRMTIAQNLEQLLGKTAALSGAIGDGTSFMNDGSPQEYIGGILEELGYEKYGNEVMYNGATGEQIQAYIFIGPVYGMRLKHMVEDKWNARAQGRKEVRTHQPTGGRGAQGGLKIGEMDRDAIIAHAGMSFVKESFMERSDGATIPICVGCGTIPIYNPRLNISICSMCDGPVRYIGDTVNTLEILPPLGRPKSKIVQVEMPYSTKLLTQEQETYLNLCTRFITTSGFERLSTLELSGTSSAMIKELPRMILPEIVAPAYIEEIEKPTLTVEQLRSMGTMVNEQKAELDIIQEENPEQLQEEIVNGQVIPVESDVFGQVVEQPVNMEAPMNMAVPVNIEAPMNMAAPVNMIIQPQPSQQQLGGLLPPGGQGVYINSEERVEGPQTPGGGPMLAVDTSPFAFMRDGLEMGGSMGMGRAPRRNPFRNMGGQMMGGQGMMNSPSPNSGIGISHSSNPPIRVTKME